MSHIETSTLKEPKPNTLFILDIDSTLVTTHQRNQAILQAFIESHSLIFPEDCKRVQEWDCQLGDYGFRSTMQRKGLREADLSCFDELNRFWKQHFFSNTYLDFDQPTAGAVQWTQFIHQQQIPFVYLTARHKNSMWDGTLKTMDKMGFPIDKEKLFLKEDLSLADEDYKSRLISKFVQLYPGLQMVLIDNEPVVLNKVAENHPQVGLVWFELTHSGKMEPPAQALPIQSFIF